MFADRQRSAVHLLINVLSTAVLCPVPTTVGILYGGTTALLDSRNVILKFSNKADIFCIQDRKY